MEVLLHDQADPCGARLSDRHHGAQQLACLCLWVVVRARLRLLCTSNLLLRAASQSLLPAIGSVLSAGLLSARCWRRLLSAGHPSGSARLLQARDSRLLPPGCSRLIPRAHSRTQSARHPSWTPAVAKMSRRGQTRRGSDPRRVNGCRGGCPWWRRSSGT